MEVTNPDKVFFPEGSITKGDLVGYYTEIAPVILPYLRDRLVMMQRLPNGIGGPRFYQSEGSPGVFSRLD
jgi:bifunctional non-homologous end joining protein LigD